VCAILFLKARNIRPITSRDSIVQLAISIVHDESIGILEVSLLRRKTAGNKEPFLKEERSLINTMPIELGEMIAHMQAEKALVEQSRDLEAFLLQRLLLRISRYQEFSTLQSQRSLC